MTLGGRQEDRFTPTDEQWVPSLAGDLAWVATPPDAFADRVPWAEDEFPWEVRETRELEPRTLDMREPDVGQQGAVFPRRDHR